MVRYILTLLCLSVSLMSTARSIEKRYSSYLSEKGTINFFRPQKLKNNTNMGKFKFDMTYISHKDSVIVNCTLNVMSGELISNLELKNGEKKKSGENVFVIFRNVIKDGFQVRVSSRFLFTDIQECFNNQTPLVFCFQMKDGTTCTASYTPSQWKKERQQVSRILSSLNF